MNQTNGSHPASPYDFGTPQLLSDDLRRYLALILHWWWLLALATLLAALSAYIVSKRTMPVYQATTTILINEAPGNKTADYTSILTSERLARTYTELFTSGPTLEGVISRLDLDTDPTTLKKAVTAALVRDTQLIRISVEDTSPARAAEIANTLVVVFTEQNTALQAERFADSKQSLAGQLELVSQQIDQTNAALAALPNNSSTDSDRTRLETAANQYRQTYASILQSYEQVRLAESQATSSVAQVEPATTPEDPIRPRTLMNTALAAVVGGMLAVGAVFLMEALDDTVKGADDISRLLRLPVLGLIAKAEEEEEGPSTMLEPRSPVAEAFRSLRTNIQFASVDRSIRTLLITSPMPKDGKSTIVANVGVVMAQSGRKVTIVDADLRRPTIHKKLKISNRRGLTDMFVLPEIILDGFLKPTGEKNLTVLSSGGLPPNPSELLASNKMLEILDALTAEVDFVIVDTPPVMAVTDSSILAARVDGVLLVIRPGETKMSAALQTVEQLRRSGSNLIGVVLNDVENKRARYYYYYKGYYAYNYYYGDAADSKNGHRRKRSRKASSPEPQTAAE